MPKRTHPTGEAGEAPISSTNISAFKPATFKDSTREALLDAASSLMREQDRTDISILEIAARAGVNHAMIRYHFGRKDGLLMALLERDVTRRIQQMERLSRKKASASERMRIHLEGVVDTYYAIPYLNRLIQRIVWLGDPDQIRHIAENLLQPIANAQARLIAEGIASGEFRKVDPKLFYFNSIGAADGLYSNRLTLSVVFGGLPNADAALHMAYKTHTVQVLMKGLLADTSDMP